MDKILELDISEFLAKVTVDNVTVTNWLETLTKELQNPEHREKLHLELFQRLTLVIENVNDTEVMTWTLRVLRNGSVNCSKNQGLLYQSQAIRIIVQKFLTPEIKPQQSLRALSLQVIGNSIAGNPEQCEKLLLEFDVLDWLAELFEDGESKVCNYSAMIGSTLTNLQPILTLSRLKINCVHALLDHVNLDFVALWLESLTLTENFVSKFYGELTDEFKVKYLQAITANAKIPQLFPKEALEYLVTNFKRLSDQILVMGSDCIPDDFNVREITAMMELFCKLVHGKGLANLMKSDMSLVITTIGLLRSIHEIGTSGQNCFTPIEKLETLRSDSVGVEAEPGFLFKADLIRFLGSLVQDFPANQNQVREMGVLPVIMNCTKVDGRNPFIPQCSVVTLKFLLEGNPENQAYVKQLQKTEMDK